MSTKVATQAVGVVYVLVRQKRAAGRTECLLTAYSTIRSIYHLVWAWPGKQRHELNQSRECEACGEAEKRRTRYCLYSCMRLWDLGLDPVAVSRLVTRLHQHHGRHRHPSPPLSPSRHCHHFDALSSSTYKAGFASRHANHGSSRSTTSAMASGCEPSPSGPTSARLHICLAVWPGTRDR